MNQFLNSKGFSEFDRPRKLGLSALTLLSETTLLVSDVEACSACINAMAQISFSTQGLNSSEKKLNVMQIKLLKRNSTRIPMFVSGHSIKYSVCTREIQNEKEANIFLPWYDLAYHP